MGHTACTDPQCLYSTAIPLLPLWAIWPVQSLSACTVQLYLYFPYGPYGLYRASVLLQGCTSPFYFTMVRNVRKLSNQQYLFIYLFNQSVSVACASFLPSALYLCSSFLSWLHILILLSFVSVGTCTVWPILVLAVHPKLFLYLQLLLFLLSLLLA